MIRKLCIGLFVVSVIGFLVTLMSLWDLLMLGRPPTLMGAVCTDVSYLVLYVAWAWQAAAELRGRR